ncbi:MAG: hypothetical protein ACOCS6_00910, partial [Desulfosalsimonas sp.]
MSQNEVPGWKRMRFKGNKVWMEVDDSGRPAVADKKVRIKYQLDQPHEYRVSPKSLTELNQGPQENRGEKPRTRSAKPAGNTRQPEARTKKTAAGRDAVVID